MRLKKGDTPLGVEDKVAHVADLGHRRGRRALENDPPGGAKCHERDLDRLRCRGLDERATRHLGDRPTPICCAGDGERHALARFRESKLESPVAVGSKNAPGPTHRCHQTVLSVFVAAGFIIIRQIKRPHSLAIVAHQAETSTLFAVPLPIVTPPVQEVEWRAFDRFRIDHVAERLRISHQFLRAEVLQLPSRRELINPPGLGPAVDVGIVYPHDQPVVRRVHDEARRERVWGVVGKVAHFPPGDLVQPFLASLIDDDDAEIALSCLVAGFPFPSVGIGIAHHDAVVGHTRSPTECRASRPTRLLFLPTSTGKRLSRGRKDHSG